MVQKLSWNQIWKITFSVNQIPTNFSNFYFVQSQLNFTTIWDNFKKVFTFQIHHISTTNKRQICTARGNRQRNVKMNHVRKRNTDFVYIHYIQYAKIYGYGWEQKSPLLTKWCHHRTNTEYTTDFATNYRGGIDKCRKSFARSILNNILIPTEFH